MWSYFRDPRHAIHSAADGYALIADSFGWNPGRLNPRQWNFLSIVPEPSGEVVPVVLIAFVLVSLPVLRRGPTQARALIGVTAASIAAGILSIWRTIDPVISYRLGWLPMIVLLTASGTLWLVWILLRPALGLARFRWVGVSAAGVVVAGILAVTTMNAAEARSVHLHRFSANGSDVVPTLLSHAWRDLPQHAARSSSRRGIPVPGGSYPLTVLWLEERGYDARVPDDRTPLLFGYTELTFGAHRVR